MTITIKELGYDVKESYTPTEDEDLPYIGLEHIESNTLHLSNFGSSTEVRSSKYKFRKGDILFGTLRPYFRKLIVAPFDGVCSTEICVIRQDDPSERDFLFYSLAQKTFIEYATTNSNGARPRTKWDLFSDFKLKNISKQDRKKIGSTLSAYDNLMENNRHRIQLLEHSARLLYREWFVHLRFPAHEHVRIIDGVPEGWELKRIEDVAETIGGGTPSTKVTEYWENGEITWFIPTDLTNNDCLLLLKSERKITQTGLKESSAKMLPPETILMTSRATLGFFGLYDGEACTNQGFISIIPKIENFRMYLLQNLIYRKEQIISLAGGTTYKEINKTTFRNMNIVIPSHELLKEYEEFAYNLIKQVRIIKKQNQKLEEARDILLPRLMNGEITV